MNWKHIPLPTPDALNLFARLFRLCVEFDRVLAGRIEYRRVEPVFQFDRSESGLTIRLQFGKIKCKTYCHR